MIENPMFGILHCTGEDAEKFLQGQLSADIKALSDTKGTISCYLNLKGRVIAAMFIIKRPEGYWLILPKDLIPALQQKLKKFIAFSKAQLVDISNQYCVEGIQSEALSSAAYDVNVSTEAVSFCLSPEKGLSLRIRPSTPECLPLSPQFIKAMFEAQIPWIGKEQSEQFLPHYINLVALNAVSFNKGCFVGQEIVARMHYKGHLNKKLMLINSSELPEDEVVNKISLDHDIYTLVSRKG